MIYTCYEMIRDCRAGQPEGWTYFLTQYVPVIRRLLAHYFRERELDRSLIERVLLKLHAPESSLFQSVDPAPERAFLGELRQHLLGAVEADSARQPPEAPIEIETLAAALDPLTLTEKLVMWFETMRYQPADAARMLRMSPQTAEKIRGRGGELVRGNVDTWNQRLLEENGAALGEAAHALATKDCLAAKSFFDVIDGRATWRGREDMERHVKNCWHCLDHYCRLLEVVDLLRDSKRLSEAESQHYQQLLGIQPRKKSFWRR